MRFRRSARPSGSCAPYLEKVTGAHFEVVEEKNLPAGQRAIYVGRTNFARAEGLNFDQLGEEESVLRTVPGGLILTGGRPRGTLYAVYTFLEDALGCRWYTPWCEKVPSRPACSIPSLNRRVSPAFSYRDTYTHCPDERIFPHREQWKWYVIRNRFNGAGVGAWIWGTRKPWTAGKGYCGIVPRPDSEIGAGWAKLGGPHTFALLVPPDKYFKDHPEYYSERNGKRVPCTGVNGNHLCLTNPELRKVMIENVTEAMREFPEMRIFSVCMNDGGCTSCCDCKKCKAFAEKYSWTDLHVDFINAVADAVRKEFPRNYIYTLAYSYASAPPKAFKYRDNVILQACLLSSNKVRLTAGAGSSGYENPGLAAWAKYAPNIWVWDYVHPSGMPVTFLQPV